MKLEINNPNLTQLEVQSYAVMNKLNKKDIEAAKEELEKLLKMLVEQQRIKDEWKDLMFSIANKL